MGEKPTKAPLRVIVDRFRSKRGVRYDKVRVSLECDHTALISRGHWPTRTRCYECLQEAVAKWEAEHTCEHGVLIETEDDVCKDCRIEELEEEVARLRDLHR